MDATSSKAEAPSDRVKLHPGFEKIFQSIQRKMGQHRCADKAVLHSLLEWNKDGLMKLPELYQARAHFLLGVLHARCTCTEHAAQAQEMLSGILDRAYGDNTQIREAEALAELLKLSNISLQNDKKRREQELQRKLQQKAIQKIGEERKSAAKETTEQLDALLLKFREEGRIVLDASLLQNPDLLQAVFDAMREMMDSNVQALRAWLASKEQWKKEDVARHLEMALGQARAQNPYKLGKELSGKIFGQSTTACLQSFSPKTRIAQIWKTFGGIEVQHRNEGTGKHS